MRTAKGDPKWIGVMFFSWFSAFIVTQAVEAPIYRLSLDARRTPWRLALGASVITHPVVFFVFPNLGFSSYWESILYAEAFAIALEAAYLSCLGVSYSVLWAGLANGLSVAVGLSLRATIGWP